MLLSQEFGHIKTILKIGYMSLQLLESLGTGQHEGCFRSVSSSLIGRSTEEENLVLQREHWFECLHAL